MFFGPQNVIQQLQTAVGFGNQPTTTLSSLKTIEENLRFYPLSNQYYTLAWMPMTYSVCANVLSVPAEDAFRQSIDIITQDAKQEDVVLVKNWLEKKNILRLMTQFSATVAQFGGGGVIIDDYSEDPTKPFNLKKLKKGSPVTFIVADRWQLIVKDATILNEMQRAYQEPKQLLFVTESLIDNMLPYESE
jgi:hypothetical protein